VLQILYIGVYILQMFLHTLNNWHVSIHVFDSRAGQSYAIVKCERRTPSMACTHARMH